MSFINHAAKELNCKIVYYGPGMGGKTTNLQYIYNQTHPQNRGKMVSLTGETERTLFFDFLPLSIGEIRGFNTRFHLYTVPGQHFYDASRKLVLKGVDGVVFVADSQMDRQRANIQAFQNLEANLRLNGSSLDELPVVLQYNKRDVPNAAPVEYLEFLLNNRQRRFLSFEAEAKGGRNVVATLNAISQGVLARFRHQMIARQGTVPSQMMTAAR